MGEPREPIGVIGTGYVGLVTAAGFAELGSDVYCVDIDEHKIAALQRGEVPIYEPGLAEVLAEHRERLHFSTTLDDALANARLLFVSVGTPPTYSGDADLSSVLAVAESMPASKEHALVMKSTVPCGTGRSISRLLAEQGKGELAYVSCPEFLKEGSALADFRARTASSSAMTATAGPATRCARSTQPLGATVVRTDVASAEMIKLAANAFLATKISFINEIANVCEETGANVLEVARGVGLDGRIGPKFLAAGIGYGGSCFTKDVSALKLLAANSGYHFQLLGSVIEVNELQKRRVVSKLARHLGDLAGRRVALLGLAFKPNTDDMRGASSLVLAARLEAEGAHVRAYDPVAADEARRIMPDLDCAPSAAEALEGADAAVLVTEWPEFLALDWKAVAATMAGDVVVDGRNALDAEAVRAAGLRLRGNRHRMSAPTTQALILAGGEGTRLRPLTSRVAKPVVTLVDRPFIAYMLEWLRRHGVTDVVLSCGFLAAGVRAELGDGARHGVTLHYVEEPEPLGTARRSAARRRPAGRALPRLQRRHPHRPRSRRPARPARAHRRDGDARAGRGPGCKRLRPRALRAGRGGSRVRGEAAGARRRRAAGQRRRVRARAEHPRADPARARRLARARGLACADRSRPVR